MAIGHLAIRSHSRAKSHTAAAALAYRCGATLRSPDGAVHDYSRRARTDVAATGIAAPHGTPIATNLQTLADAVEAAERRRDSQIGRDFQPAIPAELDEVQGIELVRDFAAELQTQYASVAVWSVHRPDRRGDVRNAHGHIWMPTRDLSEDGQFGKKLTRLQSPKTSGAEVKKIRALWQECANNALQRAGQNARVDTGRRRDGRPPQPTLGSDCTAIERRAAAESVGTDQPLPGMSVSTLCSALETIDPAGCATDAGRELAAYTAEHGRTQTPATPETVWPRRRRSVRDSTQRRRRRTRVRAPVPTGATTQAERDVRELTSALADVNERLTAARTAQESVAVPAAPSPPPEPVDEPVARPAARTGYDDIAAALAARDAARRDAPSRTEEDPPMSDDDHPDHPLRETLRGIVRPPIAIPAESGRKKPVLKAPVQAPDFSTRGILERARGSDSDPTPTPSARTALDAFLDEQKQRQEQEQPPIDHDIAKARRRRGPAVSAHADIHGVEPTADESRAALKHLAGDQARPGLDDVVHRFAVACLNGTGPGPAGEDDLVSQLANSVRSPQSARAAARLTLRVLDQIRTELRTRIAAIARWRELAPQLLDRIRQAIVPLEIQHRRDERARAAAAENARVEMRQANQRQARARQAAPDAPPTRTPDPDWWN